MNRPLAYVFVSVMLFTVIGQSLKMRTVDQQPVSEITLHESRLIPFLVHIQDANPQTYETILLNLRRISPVHRGPSRYQFEEILVAEKLLQRLTGKHAGQE